MVRLTRAQQQERTLAAVLAAARDEFAEHGYVEAKVDRIAERAELTRGAVYSNFPGKRALYLAVLVDMVEGSAAGEVPRSSPPSAAAALGAFARVWLERLPLAGDTPAAGHCSCARWPVWSTTSRPAPRWRRSAGWRLCCWPSRSSRADRDARGRRGGCGWPSWC